jgi:hypothetical protein
MVARRRPAASMTMANKDPRARGARKPATAGVGVCEAVLRARPKAELSLGLHPGLPMPRGRQLGTARWCHARYTPSCRVDDKRNLAPRHVPCKRKSGVEAGESATTICNHRAILRDCCRCLATPLCRVGRGPGNRSIFFARRQWPGAAGDDVGGLSVPSGRRGALRGGGRPARLQRHVPPQLEAADPTLQRLGRRANPARLCPAAGRQPGAAAARRDVLARGVRSRAVPQAPE